MPFDIVVNFLIKIPITRLFMIFIIYIYYNFLKKKKVLPDLKIISWIIIVIFIRDSLCTIFYTIKDYAALEIADAGFIIILSEAVIILVYLLWVRIFTGKRKADLLFYFFNIIFAVFIIIDLLFKISIDFQILGNIVPHLWLIFDIIYFAVISYQVSEYNTPNPVMIQNVRLELVRLPIALNVIFIFFFLFSDQNYSSGFIRFFLLPLSYFIPLYLLYKYNENFENEDRVKYTFLQDDLDSLFDFMRNLGSAIAEKLDLSQILNFIIASAVKSTSAEAGAILLVDDFEDILKVEAVNGIFPPPYEVADSVKVKITRIQSTFKSTPIKIGVSILGETAKLGKPIFIKNTLKNELMKHNIKNDTLFISSIIAIPLIVSKRILGVISIIKRERDKFFSASDFDHIKTFADYASLTIDFIMTYMELIEKREMERELGIAAEIQQKLLPRKIPRLNNATIGAFSIPAKGVSGDYFDILRLHKGKIGLVICDVAGKGVPAALVMVMIRSILHLITSANRDASTIVTWINRGITGRIDIDHFATLGFLIYDQEKKEVIYSNAAHHPLLIFKQKTGKLEHIDTEGLPIGVEQDTKYGQKRFNINKGDVLVLYTDGIIEAMNQKGEQYTFESLAKIITDNATLSPNELINKIKLDLKAFVGNAPQHDDQTLLLMKVN